MSVRAAGAPAAIVQPKPQCRVSIGAPLQTNRRLDEVLAIGFAKMQLHSCADTAGRNTRNTRKGPLADTFDFEDELGVKNDEEPDPKKFMAEWAKDYGDDPTPGTDRPSELMSVLNPPRDDFQVSDSELQKLMDDFEDPDPDVQVDGFDGFEEPDQDAPSSEAPGPSTSKSKKWAKAQYSKRQTQILIERYESAKNYQDRAGLRPGEVQPMLDKLNENGPLERKVTAKDLKMWFQNRNRPERQKTPEDRAIRDAQLDSRGKKVVLNYGSTATADQKKQLLVIAKHIQMARSNLKDTTLHSVQGAKEVLEEQYQTIGDNLSKPQIKTVIQALKKAIKGTTFYETDVREWWRCRNALQEKIENERRYKSEHGIPELNFKRGDMLIGDEHRDAF